MERRTAYKRTATTTNNQKQIRVDRMAKQRKESRASKFQTVRNLAAEETSQLSNFTITDTPKDDKPVLKEVQKKKNIKESLQKWQEEKQKRESLKQKSRKPEFVVSRNCQSKPVTALIAVKNSTYRNVAPRVVTRRDTSSAGPMLVSFKVPEKFIFKGFKENYGETAQISEAPFVFAAPQTVLGAEAKEPLKSVKKKTTFAFNTPRNTSSTPKTFPVTPRPLSKSGPRSLTNERGNKSSALKAPTKQFIAETPLSSQKDVLKIVSSPKPPATKKRRTNDGVEEMEPAAAVEQMEIAVELSTDYFRQILDNEINVLEQHCILWDAEKNQEVPEEIEEQILLAVGMARLLIREKFNQFRGLIQNCDEPEDIKTKTLLSDLQGFWDMIKIQADNIAAMFGALEKLKANDWKEQKPAVKPKVALKRKAGAPKAAKPAAASRFKAFLAQKKVAPEQELAVKTPGSNKNTPNLKARKSGQNTPLSISKQRHESPSMNAVNAMISVSQIARSTERRSLDNLANKSLGDTSFSGLKSPAFKSPQKPQLAESNQSRAATPSRSILKKPELTPIATKGGRTVLFDVITEEEEDVDLVIQPVKHTYAQNNYEFSPPKDDFDQLLEDSAKALTPSSQTQGDEAPKSVELSTGKRRGRRSQNQSPSRPVRRSSRLQSLSELASDDLSSSGTRKGRKRSALESEMVDQQMAEEATHNDANVSKRRSSRKMSSNSDANAACGSDLISFDSPAVKVTRKRKASVKKTLMDQSF